MCSYCHKINPLRLEYPNVSLGQQQLHLMQKKSFHETLAIQLHIHMTEKPFQEKQNILVIFEKFFEVQVLITLFVSRTHIQVLLNSRINGNAAQSGCSQEQMADVPMNPHAFSPPPSSQHLRDTEVPPSQFQRSDPRKELHERDEDDQSKDIYISPSPRYHFPAAKMLLLGDILMAVARLPF